MRLFKRFYFMIDFAKYGLQVSTQINEDYIQALKVEIERAYLHPIQRQTEIDIMQENIVELANEITAKLVWLLLSQRQYKMTRAGLKLKETTESRDVSEWQAIASVSNSVCLLLQEYAKYLEVCLLDCGVIDICKIYFTTNYFYLKNC